MLFHLNMGIRCVKFNLKKMVRAFFGCVRTARTWGTPDSDQKSISLAADYTISQKAKVYFLWHIWKIQLEYILVDYWLFSDRANLFEWQLHEVEEHFVEIPPQKNAQKRWFKMKKRTGKEVSKTARNHLLQIKSMLFHLNMCVSNFI